MFRPVRALAALAALVPLCLVGSFPVAAAPPGPRLVVTRSASHVDAVRWGKGDVYVDTGIFLAAFDAPLEVRVARGSYADPVRAWQETGAAPRDIPTEMIRRWWGFRHFANLRVFRDGEQYRFVSLGWCPGWAEMQRVSDDGPRDATYPQVCSGNPFTLGSVWGIDQGWASALASSVRLRLADGDYTVDVRIAPAFRDLLEIADADATARVGLTVSSIDGCKDVCPALTRGGGGSVPRATSGAVPEDLDPDPGSVPDLRALPAYGIDLETIGGREWLSFGADVWNAGPAPLVVEGFRQADADLMDAFQYFTLDGEVIGRAPVGGFEFDDHEGHEHWHFLQFARYRLLGADKTAIMKSRKQAFCLAPTDAIDMLVPNANWQPGPLGFSRCGGPTSLWIREILPVGWGDTYFQGLFGQAFETTDLPNGTYFIEVTANPKGLLYDADPTNDTRLRKVYLRGTRGSRYIEVPPWVGIDTEGTS